MSHRFQKLLKRHVSTFLEILYRTVVFLNVFVKENFQNFQKPARHNSSNRQHFQNNFAKIKNPTQVMITQQISTKSNIEKCLKTASSFCNVFLKSRYKIKLDSKGKKIMESRKIGRQINIRERRIVKCVAAWFEVQEEIFLY